MIQAGIYGATGYAGVELVKILTRHPQVNIAFAVTHSFVGKKLSDIYVQAPSLPLISADAVDLTGVDVVFLCLPHAASAPTAIKALAAGVRVIDLSADFRLDDPDVYKEWYGLAHPAPHLLDEAIYGLTEFNREKLVGANLVAVPGCYPTSMLLGLAPLLEAQALTGTVIADSKSGVSGAGRTPKPGTHFVEISQNFYPYKVGQNHRHWPETQQVMKSLDPDAPDLIFTPHLLPVPRGILSTIYAPISISYEEARALYEARYADEQFVTVLPEGQLSTLAHIVNTNHTVLSLTMAGNVLVIASAIDNLVKGASGQAVQDMNVVFGLEEGCGLV
ncbi:MAG: N-acetyl-gamma-glutamyl-phosphate reductase [Candidatus Promineifilaceae bacterium]